MPKLLCWCGEFTHNLSPIPDAGFRTITDVELDQHYSEPPDAWFMDACGSLYECPKCGRLLWAKKGFENYRPFLPTDDMPRAPQYDPDANANAPRIVAGSAACAASDPPAELEYAWLDWSSRTQKVDERGMTMLRAAFEAAYEAGFASGRKSSTSNH